MTRDPYKVWVSEIMLQQTQVKTVTPYYLRWMRQFPTVHRLARAPLARVLKSWEGLGYYSRARNLHRAAKRVVKKFGGRLPERAEELKKLPGIGRYTAGAIASIAFNQPEPVLDGNVKRVLARVFAMKDPVDQTKGEKKLWQVAHELIAYVQKGAGDFNQSLMELGALVCLPENPRCGVCPLTKTCLAHRQRREMDFPVKARKERPEKLRTVAAVLWKNGRVLVERQPLRGRWGGLWMFPQWTHTNGKPEKKFLQKKIDSDLGLKIGNLKQRLELKHGFTKYRVRLRVYEGDGGSAVVASPAKRDEAISGRRLLRRPRGLLAMTRWARPDRLARLAFPSPHQKIAAMVQTHA